MGFWTNSGGNLKKKHRYVNLTLFPAKYPWQKDYVSPVYSHWHLSTALLQPFAGCIYVLSLNRTSLSSSWRLFTVISLPASLLSLPPTSCPPFLRFLYSFSSLLIVCFSHTVMQFHVSSHFLCNSPGSLFKVCIFCSALPVSWSLQSFCKWNDDPVCPE